MMFDMQFFRFVECRYISQMVSNAKADQSHKYTPKRGIPVLIGALEIPQAGSVQLCSLHPFLHHDAGRGAEGV